jgi:hypothetical protein
MALTDLLQWLAGAGKTGTLHIERNKVSKRIVFRQGRVIACSSDEPKDLLGHFLLSRGKIDEDTLRKALARQEETREHLGGILVDMGALTSEDLVSHLSAKAEETIFSLFDWEEAVFRFHDGQVSEERIFFPVDLRVEDILLRGLQRLDEMSRIRTVFNDPGIVLRRSGRTPPAELFENRLARKIYESIGGGRSVADILLHTHASEFLVLKFLFELFRSGLVEIEEVRQVAPPLERPARESEPAPGRDDSEPAAATALAEAAGTAPQAAVAEPAASREAAAGVAASVPAETTLGEDLEVARRLMSRGEFDSALEILNSAYRSHQGDEALGKLLAEAEAAFIDKAYRYFVPPTKVPVVVSPEERLTAEQMSPEEFYLLSRIDGSWDIKSIIQITPLREVDALRTLKRMRENGFIELKEPD